MWNKLEVDFKELKGMWNKFEANLKHIRSKFETNLKWMWNKFKVNVKQIESQQANWNNLQIKYYEEWVEPKFFVI